VGQDRKDGEGGDPDVTPGPAAPQPPEVIMPQPPAVFEREVGEAVRYERGLAVKAAAVLAVVAVIVILRTLYFALPGHEGTGNRCGHGEPGCGGGCSSAR
jgi:hypothetical protein